MRMRSILLLIVAMLAIHPHCYPTELMGPGASDGFGEHEATANEDENAGTQIKNLAGSTNKKVVKPANTAAHEQISNANSQVKQHTATTTLTIPTITK